MNPKKLILASSIALTLSVTSSQASIEAKAEQEWIKNNYPNQTQSEKRAFYIKYKESSSKKSLQSTLKSMEIDVKQELEDFNIFVAVMPVEKSNLLRSISSIEYYEPVPQHSLQAQVTPWNIDQYQARDVWDSDRDGNIDPGAPDGSGVKLCIIDTGFYAAHSDFQGINHTGWSQIPGELYTQDGNGHGTHVAGTANAVNNDRGVVGVMPGGAELIIVKVFNNAGSWDPVNSNLATAATYCRDQGANAISMSLGGGFSSAEETVFQDLYDNHNIISIAAAGNDGNDTNSYPANYDSVISVAALNDAEIAAAFSQTPETVYDPNTPPANVEWDVVELSGGGQGVLSTWPTPDGNVPVYQVISNGVTYNGGTITESGTGDVTGNLVDGGLCDSAGSWTGNVVLCERGDISFADKLNNAANGGAVGAIIFNNIAGGFNGTCNGNCTSSIPGISLSQADGQFLQTNNLGMSTQIIADDGSGCVDCSGGYNTISGTSMSTPGVAAGIGWIWDVCGGSTAVNNKDLRQLLRDSAKDLTGTQPFDPQAGEQAGDEIVYGAGYDRVTGWGLIQLADAQQLGIQRFGETCRVDLIVSPSEINICSADAQAEAVFDVSLTDFFTGTTNLTSSNIPVGASGDFSPASLDAPANTSTFTLSGLNGLATGAHTVRLTATNSVDSQITDYEDVIINSVAAVPAGFSLLSPADMATSVSSTPTLSWDAAAEATSYTIEIATDSNFNDIVVTQSGITGTSYTVSNSLNNETQYYWRVTADNICGNQASSVFSFTTSNQICFNTQTAIPDNDGAGVSTTLNIASQGEIENVIVSANVSHTWVGDLIFSLEHAGTTVVLMDRPGRVDSGVGCSANNVVTNFDDESNDPVEDMCNDPEPAIGPVAAPQEPLSGFDGLSQQGDWVLTVSDNVGADTGTINEWCLLIETSDLIYANGFD